MYQEWDSPSFTAEMLLQVCIDFFASQNFSTSIESQGKEKSLLKASITSIGATQTIRIERKGRRIRLTYPPLSHTTDGFARLGALLVTGRVVKAEAQKQLFLDHLEHQFWESLDRALASLVPRTDKN